MDWQNEPAEWAVGGGAIRMHAAAKTDFRRRPDLGEARDSGHFYSQLVAGDFVAEVLVEGEYRALYDQAGLMLRMGDAEWVKCGIELVDGVQHVSAVVTQEHSDWSVVPLADPPSALWLQLRRQAGTIEVRYRLDGPETQLLRQAYLPASGTMRVGLMCASPTGEGFPVSFHDFKVRAE